MTKHFLSIKTKDGNKHFKVPEEVYIYVRQLEYAIRYPEYSKIKVIPKKYFQNEKGVVICRRYLMI